jgi:hypothetical protein
MSRPSIHPLSAPHLRRRAQASLRRPPRRVPAVDRLEERALLATGSGVYNLGSLIGAGGVQGHVFNGDAPNNTATLCYAKQAVAIGDVNGDGIADYAFAEMFASPANRKMAGSVYVVFGGPAHLAALDAADGKVDGVIELSKLLPRNSP